jgi:hypothetical protein
MAWYLSTRGTCPLLGKGDKHIAEFPHWITLQNLHVRCDRKATSLQKYLAAFVRCTVLLFSVPMMVTFQRQQLSRSIHKYERAV